MKFITLIFIISIVFIKASYSQMFWNQAASFPGSVSGRVAIPNSASLNITGSFTLEAWIKPGTGGSGNKPIVSKGEALAYGMIYHDASKKILVSTGGSTRLLSTTLVNAGVWTHVAATYNSSTSSYSVYINGLLDNSATVPGTAPPSNTDSLLIGKGGFSSAFKGIIDEVRIWNRALSSSEISTYYKTSLGATGGVYSGLILSMTFQDDESFGTDFNTLDMSGNNNNGFLKDVTSVDLSDNPSHTIAQNDCIQLDGNNDYLAGVDSSSISPTTSMTVECWIYPLGLTTGSLILKGPPGSPDYQLSTGSSLSARINGTSISGVRSPESGRWNHIAFTYSASTGEYDFYIDAKRVASGTAALGNIINSADSIFIGGGNSSVADFNGYMDEIRIAKYVKTQDEIRNYMYESIDAANNPSVHFPNICYNLDGLSIDNTNEGGPRLFFRNNAKFSHSSAVLAQPVSPLNRADVLNFSQGYYLKTSNKEIPATGTTGLISDSLEINLNQSISDVNLYVALNHTKCSNLDITLISPSGDSVKVFDNNQSNGRSTNVVTLFDDNADSTMQNGTYVNFSNMIKPVNNMNSVFSGDNCQGVWRIRINDGVSNDTGMIYAWGVQINDQTLRERNMNMSALIQGFFNVTTELMVPDTLLVVLRNSTAPFAIVDSSKAVVDSVGKALFSFNSAKVFNNVDYFIQVNHRNSIETWSLLPVKFTFSELSYNFTSSLNKAFGNNMVLVANAPARYGIFSGDPNQDGSVNLTDIVEIFNAATNFQSGYIRTDVNGDNSANLSDIILTFNNSNLFVHTIRP